MIGSILISSSVVSCNYGSSHCSYVDACVEFSLTIHAALKLVLHLGDVGQSGEDFALHVRVSLVCKCTHLCQQ